MLYPECGIMVSESTAQGIPLYHMKGTTHTSTADLYYDATNQTLGHHKHYTFYAARVHPRMYEDSRFYTSHFSFEVWLHHSTVVNV